ncbi:MAG: small nuclear ribonucleoprotein [DPANN group archaeon]|nr:small nuclear ribonucleoprotein [DPANN group archaeon]
MNNRPIDILEKSKGKRVMIKLRNMTNVSGEIKAYDLHLNMWLDNAKITDTNTNIEKEVGKILIRGDNITYIAPSK